MQATAAIHERANTACTRRQAGGAFFGRLRVPAAGKANRWAYTCEKGASMFRKIIYWVLCKIDQPIFSPSLGNFACLNCGKVHGVTLKYSAYPHFANVGRNMAEALKPHLSPSKMMAEGTIGGEPLQIEKSPTPRVPDAGDSGE